MSSPTMQSGARRRIGRRLLVGATALTLGLSGAGAATAAPAPVVSATNPDLGPNVTIFDPSMSGDYIEGILDAHNAEYVDAETTTMRRAFLFKPGTYGTAANPLQFNVPYYTEVAGLGASPTDVVINGKIEVYNRCLGTGGTSNCIALVNFWRSLSNLSLIVNGAGQDGCRASGNFWAVSQAVSMRRVNISGGNVTFMDYCTAGPQYASGGFLADSKMPFIINGSQLQWYTRDSTIAGWSNAVWAQTFSGVEGAPADEWNKTGNHYTTLQTTPVSREKPFLYIDAAGKWMVRVPSAQTNTRGTTWDDGMTAGRSIPLSEFFIANRSHKAKVLNQQLSLGKHLLLTPGIYEVDRTINVTHADTVVLGLGLATLQSVNGATPLQIADVPGVVAAGFMVEAGATKSDALVVVGTNTGTASAQLQANPITLSDVIFRVGGALQGKVETALVINADHTLVDHTWIWRADHGTEGLAKDTVVRYAGDTNNNGQYDDDARWVNVIGNQGLVVNGDNVTATGLFVEHFQKHNVIWNGENGTTIFFQNELPYDPPTQAAWDAGNGGGTQGWAAYKVADDVATHDLIGAGVYSYNQNNPSIVTTSGIQVPVAPGVNVYHAMTVNLSAGIIDHVVNDCGTQANNSNTGSPQYVTSYSPCVLP